MTKKFVVVDHEGNPSWDIKKEAIESFSTFGTAEKRARELAENGPGHPVGIYELVYEAITPVGKTEMRKRK